ncbi:hypothetical protein BVC80_1211g53 [Macleaya cordata]|uniref:CLAVATA3/ESR (CLE)-related protein 27 n=1 Tax=Macleaya cordata TaxID=56857 RepID=A0A200Q3G3_MACCD|nr:hypothetical protein BVC80_1211g53 [Macleaya cordata]
MSLAGGRRSFMFSLVFLLIISVLQIWVCCDNCKVGAIRIFPANNWANHHHYDKFLSEKKMKKNSEEMFKRFFNGGAAGRRDFDFNRTEKSGFEDSKRRVPSCPDPLHNK